MSNAVDELIAHPRRMVALEASFNFRDLGGYPVPDAGDGATTQWGVLYRADGLQRLTPADLDVVRALGLRTVVDLRTAAELTERGTFPHHEVPVEFAHLPVMDVTWTIEGRQVTSTDVQFLVDAYRDMLNDGEARFAEGIELLARPGALPAVFHCAAGKDRTGLLAALVLGIVGVPREYVLADYALTAQAIPRMHEWAARQFPEFAERIKATPAVFFAALPEALDVVLDEVCARCGSIAGFARAIGVSEGAIERLTAALVGGVLA